jgi:FkbM family methyltransferase
MAGVLTFRNSQGVFSILANEEFILPVLSRGEAWEESVLKFYLSLIADKVVLDCGAHVGTHAIPMARTAKKVYAFEIQAKIFGLLLLNLYQNDITNVVPLRQAVGHTSKEVTISETVADGTSYGKPLTYGNTTAVNYGGIQLGEGKVKVEMITIDSLNLSDVGLLKIDVEGMEPAVLYGARETVVRCRPIIVFEHNYKSITPKMKEVLGISDEVATFSISNFLNEAKCPYSLPIKINEENFVLMPFVEIPALLFYYRSQYETISFVQNDMSHVYELTISYGGKTRGPFIVVTLSSNRIRAFFLDVKQIIDATVENGSILWDNKTVWTRGVKV